MKKITNLNIELKITAISQIAIFFNTYSRLQPVCFECPICHKVEHLKMNAMLKRSSLLCHDCLLKQQASFYKSSIAISPDDIKSISKPISPNQIIKFTCIKCGTPTSMQYRHFNGVCEHCKRSTSGRIAQNNPTTKSRRDTTMQQRYGVTNMFQNTDYIKKCFERKYGPNVTNAQQIESARKKLRDTMIKRYGGYTLASKELRKKVDATVQAVYGADNIRNSEYYHERYKAFKDRLYKNMKKIYLLDSIYFDSSWEVAYYIWLRDNNINFVYHPLPGIKYVSEGIEHTYYPDFNVNGQLIEIKGNQFFNKDGSYKIKSQQDADKYNCIIANSIIYRQKDILQYLKYVHEKYGPSYIKSLKQFK